MDSMSKQDKNRLSMDFIRAKNLHVIEQQEKAKKEKQRQLAEDLAKKQ